MLKRNNFRIYPNETQKSLFSKTFGCCRKVYNMVLDMRISAYRNGEKCNYSDTSSALTSWKKCEDFSYLKEVDAVALQQSLRDLDIAYKNFFREHRGFPKFKSKHNHSYSYRTHGNVSIDKDGKHLIIPKAGAIKIKLSLEIGKIHSVTIQQRPSGKYFVSILHEVKPPVRVNAGGVIGIDVGLKEFYSDSNGNVVENPRYLEKYLKKIKREQRRLSKRVNGSNNYDKQRVRLARACELVTNQRTDFLQKLSTKLINENQVICVEHLNVKGMLKNHNLAQHISSVSWSSFFGMLEHKSQWYGNNLVKIDTFYPSSQTCFECGYQNRQTKDLGVREWTCPNCGAHHDRDVNAANNILRKGLEMLSA